MDLHQIGTGLGIGSGSYAQQEQQQQSSTTSTPTPSSSVSPSTRQHPHHFQRHQHQQQLYNPLPTQSHGSYSPSIPNWPRSRDLLQQQQQQKQYQPEQSNIKREVMSKHLDTGNGSKNADDSMPSTSDFVKKLYKFVPVCLFVFSFIFFEYRFIFSSHQTGFFMILEDPSVQIVVSWGPLSDCFLSKYVCFFLYLIPFYLSIFI